MEQIHEEEFDVELYIRKPRERFSQARVIAALKKAAKSRSGVPLKIDKHAARILRCSPSTVRRYIRVYPKVQAVEHEIRKEWQTKLDEIIAEIKARQRGRRQVIDPDKLAETMRGMTAALDLNLKNYFAGLK